jgi:hypothetical protein
MAILMESSAGRVPAHTPRNINSEITQAIQRRIEWFADCPTEIPARLRQLDREWDIERALAALSSMLTLTGLAFGFAGNRTARKRGGLVALAVQGFYLQHTIQGWCPPLPLLRRMGFRTPAEIERERCALKAVLRADNARQVGEATIDSLEDAILEGSLEIIVEDLGPDVDEERSSGRRSSPLASSPAAVLVLRACRLRGLRPRACACATATAPCATSTAHLPRACAAGTSRSTAATRGRPAPTAPASSPPAACSGAWQRRTRPSFASR